MVTFGIFLDLEPLNIDKTISLGYFSSSIYQNFRDLETESPEVSDTHQSPQKPVYISLTADNIDVWQIDENSEMVPTISSGSKMLFLVDYCHVR